MNHSSTVYSLIVYFLNGVVNPSAFGQRSFCCKAGRKMLIYTLGTDGFVMVGRRCIVLGPIFICQGQHLSKLITSCITGIMQHPKLL